MIEVGVADDHGVDTGRWYGECCPVARPEFAQALEQPSIDQHSLATHLEEEPAARDGAHATEHAQGGPLCLVLRVVLCR